MQVDWYRFLRALDCEVKGRNINALQYCPLHTPKIEPSLKVCKELNTDKWIFQCQKDDCLFHGDAAALIAKKRSISLEEAAKLFNPGGLFHDTVQIGTSYDGDNYIVDQKRYDSVIEYLKRSHELLFEDRGTWLLNKLTNDNLIAIDKPQLNLPESFGVLHQDQIPDILKKYDKNKYKKGTFAIYAYTYNHQVNRVRIMNMAEVTKPYTDINILVNHCGMFMEENINEKTKAVFATLNEAAGIALYWGAQQRTTIRIPLICYGKFPLSHQYKCLEKIVLLSLTDAPLTLETALQIFNEPVIVQGRDNIDICVYESKMSSYNTLLSISEKKAMEDVPVLSGNLRLWIAKEIKDEFSKNNIETITKALAKIRLSDNKKLELIKELEQQKAPASIIKLVDTVIGNDCTYVLGNGNKVVKTIYGLRLILANGAEQTKDYALSTLSIDVCSRIFTSDNQTIYDCDISHHEKGYIGRMKLNERDCNTEGLRATVARFLMEKHQSPYYAFYSAKNFIWRDLFAKIAENKPIYQEIPKLGLNQHGIVDFTNIVISLNDKKIYPQGCIFTIPDTVCSEYSGLQINDGCIESIEIFKRLFKTAEQNVYIAGFVAIFCHAISRIWSGKINKENETNIMLNHMFMVETESGMWQAILGQLRELFAGKLGLSIMPRNLTHIEEARLKRFGVLPYITELPKINRDKLVQLISDTPCNLITTIDSNSADLFNNRSDISFIVNNNYSETDNYIINANNLVELRKAFPSFLIELLTTELSQTDATAITKPNKPAIATYRIICAKLGLAPAENIEDMIQQHYSERELLGINSFLNAVYSTISKEPALIRILRGLPTSADMKSNKPPHVITMTDTCVAINKQLVKTVNDYEKPYIEFSVNVLANDLNEKKLMRDKPAGANIDMHRYWVIDRQIWDERVDKVPSGKMHIINGQARTIELMEFTA